MFKPSQYLQDVNERLKGRLDRQFGEGVVEAPGNHTTSTTMSELFSIFVISLVAAVGLTWIGWILDSLTTTRPSTESKNQETKSTDTGPTEVDKDKFYRMIAKLENDERNSDVKIVSSDGMEFHAYRWILSETSAVFEAMFRSGSDMMEETGVVKFLLSGATVKLLLHFIYTGEVGTEWSNPGIVDELTYAAVKYEIEDLKNFLDKNFGKICTADNAGGLLALAERMAMKKAVEDILAFIREKCKDPVGFFEIVNKTKVTDDVI